MKIKQNDTRPYARATLYSDKAGDIVVDISTATALKFNMKPKAGGVPKLNGVTAMKTGTGTDGKIEYRWTTGDTDTIGTFDCEFEVTFADGGKQTFPPDGYLTVEIVAELNT